jgi:hypothetical protein
MKTSRYAVAQIIAILWKAEGGVPVAGVLRCNIKTSGAAASLQCAYSFRGGKMPWPACKGHLAATKQRIPSWT